MPFVRSDDSVKKTVYINSNNRPTIKGIFDRITKRNLSGAILPSEKDRTISKSTA